MSSALEKIRKFLKLEIERGYDNRAVVGGLDKIIPAWEQEAHQDGLPSTVVRQICDKLSQYPSLSTDLREKIIQEILEIAVNSSNFAPEPAFSPPPGEEIDYPLLNNAKKTTFSVNPANPAPHESKNKPTGLEASLKVLPGIGPKNAQNLEKLGLHKLEDLLYFFPRRYDDFSKMKPINQVRFGEELSVAGTVQKSQLREIKGNRTLFEAVISDGTGSLRVSWFNQPWLEKNLRPGVQVVLSGKVDMYLGRLCMNNPEWELLDQEHLHTNRIVPVYPLTAGVSQKVLRRLMYQTVSFWATRIADFLPDEIRSAGDLLPLPQALRQIHFPDSDANLNLARQRLAFDEIFLIQLGVLRQKQNWQNRTAHIFEISEDWLTAQINRLPFPLTNAQQRAIREIRADLSSGRPMNRLLQGDVGSGKTVVAALAIAMVTASGMQAALMAPTSILAEQHYRSFQKLFVRSDTDDSAPFSAAEVRLLVGDTPEKEKQEIREALASGEIKLLIGTHALIEDPIEFKHLQLAVIDEQHRFGVAQRSALRAKGNNPHLLVMTATPIPRSLALTIYGDLDLSVMDEMPAGRQPIETRIFTPLERERAYSFIRAQVRQGYQAFIIYPLVDQEQSETEDALAAVQQQQRLQKEVFPDLKIGLLHGRMRPEEKELVMRQFRDREYHILVSTSVIEVGVDVPNATVMLIEGANRFGLAQLHQFRGRVGRGNAKSYCILIPDNEDAAENERLSAMVETNDGFVLAERDLQQRGPGEFLGTRQAGFADLRIANLTDVHTIEKARNLAQQLFEKDPQLSDPRYQPLLEKLNAFWGEGRGDIS
ncbi:ATP-dependent DNA helicase RecG [Bellilinea sp.]|jgi:ATP-dependent DNA helicase RecG|uniref:ATP-dependent DNA helicase RecG n=1 Tax=Bellilinea sp. TaxID=2838785 RepID=UPI002ADE5FAC|nr:ATP-dependent DNA helicase RecG [Bellilinea sp.]